MSLFSPDISSGLFFFYAAANGNMAGDMSGGFHLLGLYIINFETQGESYAQRR